MLYYYKDPTTGDVLQVSRESFLRGLRDAKKFPKHWEGFKLYRVSEPRKKTRATQPR